MKGKSILHRVEREEFSVRVAWSRVLKRAMGKNISERGNRNTKATRQEHAGLFEVQKIGQCGWSGGRRGRRCISAL